MNHKLIYRLYVEEGLILRRKGPRRRKSCRVRMERPNAMKVNDSWSMDFMSDQLYQGCRYRVLTIVDNFSRESLARSGSSIRSTRIKNRLALKTIYPPNTGHLLFSGGLKCSQTAVRQATHWQPL